jgi:hypothetical protein
MSAGQLAGESFNLNDQLWVERARGQPGRERSSKPARRSSKKRFRHILTTSRRVSRRAAIWSLESPSAARRIILTRWTSKYDNVYFAARRRSFSFFRGGQSYIKWANTWRCEQTPAHDAIPDRISQANNTLAYLRKRRLSPAEYARPSSSAAKRQKRAFT